MNASIKHALVIVNKNCPFCEKNLLRHSMLDSNPYERSFAELDHPPNHLRTFELTLIFT